MQGPQLMGTLPITTQPAVPQLPRISLLSSDTFKHIWHRNIVHQFHVPKRFSGLFSPHFVLTCSVKGIGPWGQSVPHMGTGDIVRICEVHSSTWRSH